MQCSVFSLCDCLPCARIQLAKVKWIVCFCIVRSFEKEDFLENSHPVLFCLIKKGSFKPFVFWDMWLPSTWYTLPYTQLRFLEPDIPLLVLGSFVSSAPQHGMTSCSIFERNPLRTSSNPTSKCFFAPRQQICHVFASRATVSLRRKSLFVSCLC